MMKSPRDASGEIRNAVGYKAYLEFTVHLLEYGYFNPIVFCHDDFWFDRSLHAQVMIGFVNLLLFLYSCGVTVDTELVAPCDSELILYQGIMPDDDLSEIIKSYRLLEIDFSEFDLQHARVPDNCNDNDFDLVKIYLQLRTGAALSKRAIEKITNRHFSDTEMLTLRKRLQTITGREIVKRIDNSYEMR